MVLAAVVSPDGTVSELTPISGPSGLVKAAMDAVQQWTYKPFLLNGAAVEVHTTVTVNFTP